QELTYTCVPPGSGVRSGIDRDEDGALDRDEIDAATDPADAGSTPLGAPTCGAADLIAGDKILIKNKVPDDETKNKIILVSKDGTIDTPAPGGADDPRCGLDPPGTVKASITFGSASSGELHSSD